MSWRKKEIINVLNYNENVVTISTRDNGYAFAPAEGDVPSIVPLTPTEIEYVNSNSNAFKSGILRFPKELEEEIYLDLRIVGWKDILTNQDIIGILTSPTIEGLQKIISIKNPSSFERVRGLFTKLRNSEEVDISIRVEKIINARYRELSNRQSKSDIQVVERDIKQNTIDSEEVAQLKLQVEQMQKMITEMAKPKEEVAAVEVEKKTKK